MGGDGGGSSGGNLRRNDSSRRRRGGSDDDDDEVRVVNADGRAMDDDDDDDYDYDDDDDGDDGRDPGGRGVVGPALHHASNAVAAARGPPSLSTMFAPPLHLVHRAGGFQGARNFAKDARRWLLANVQSDGDFACHALNRDVWRDELVENLVREGFVLWQAVSVCVCDCEAPSRASVVRSLFLHRPFPLMRCIHFLPCLCFV